MRRPRPVPPSVGCRRVACLSSRRQKTDRAAGVVLLAWEEA